MKRFLPVLSIILFVVVAFPSFGQVEQDTLQEKKLYKIVKQNGMEYVGEILSDDGREVLIVTDDLGKVYIPKADIKSMHLLEEELIISGNFREVGPFVTRYYFTNNALPITKKEHYAMIHLYGPEVHFAFTDNFSFGVMSTWIASPMGIAMKYSMKTGNKKVHLSVGSIMLSSGYLYQAKGWGGLHWGSVTYGKPGKNITFSGGYGYIDLGFNLQHENEKGWKRMKHGPVVSIAGLTPVGKKGSFIFDSMIALTEHRNYFEYNALDVNGNEVTNILKNSGTKLSVLMMPGMRFQNTDTRAFQIALAGVFEYSTNGFDYADGSQKLRTIPVPMMSWFFKF
ncbi:MAG: hypothetical protein R2780_02160 [Crocinitomicaceae bacterium]|nr:hypothetical protein [Crocinitomicaceae bacterium]